MTVSCLAGCGGKDSEWLNEAYKDYFPIGAALAQYSLDRFGSDLMQHYGSITPESEMKWNIIHPADGRYNFSQADELVEYAKETGRLVRGHTLVCRRSEIFDLHGLHSSICQILPNKFTYKYILNAYPFCACFERRFP